MKALQSNESKSDLTHSEPPLSFSSSAPISEPTRTVLVVDDDDVLRSLEAEVLRQQGYNVLQAESAEEALRFAAAAAPIHLLVTDFLMPEVDGIELTRRFRGVHPDAPVLMVSGSLPMLPDGAEDLHHCEFLAKPFELNQLIHKVRALLDANVPLPRRAASCSS